MVNIGNRLGTFDGNDVMGFKYGETTLPSSNALPSLVKVGSWRIYIYTALPQLSLPHGNQLITTPLA